MELGGKEAPNNGEAKARTRPAPRDLREFVRLLEAAGELERWPKPLSSRDIARVIEASDKAVLIEHPVGYSMPILANAMASRSIWAIALGVDEADLLSEVRRRLSQRIAPVRVSTGPVKEIIELGEKADLTSLPAYLQHELDGAPYISAAMDVTRHLGRNGYNVGTRRLMLRGPRETGIDMVAPSDLRDNYRRIRESGETRFPIAMVIGSHPLDYMGTQWHAPADDEYEILGGLRGEPVKLVRCETVDLEVPAEAEIVVEGYLEGGWSEVEGPFGEYHGSYGSAHSNPVFKVTAITRRHDALFQTATIGGRKLHHTDTQGLMILTSELDIWEAVAGACGAPTQVYCPPSGASHNARVSLRVKHPGDGRNALVAALSSNWVKMVMVFDDDIDIFDDKMVEWALATRYQADRDTIILTGMRCAPIEPSLPPHEGAQVTTSKLGIDATRRYDKPAESFDIPRMPFADQPFKDPEQERSGMNREELAIQMVASLSEGPRFVDLLERFPKARSADLVNVIGWLRERNAIRLDRDGRYRPSDQ
jgi:2,5-furandicarboxylate decarboxylase 1